MLTVNMLSFFCSAALFPVHWVGEPERGRKERYSPFAVQSIGPEPPSLDCRRVDLGIAPTCALVPVLELHLTITSKPHERSCGITPEPPGAFTHVNGHWPYSTDQHPESLSQLGC